MTTGTEPEDKSLIETPEEAIKIPDVLPVLPLRDIVIFPFMIVPLFVSRERSIHAVDQALAENRMIRDRQGAILTSRDRDAARRGRGAAFRLPPFCLENAALPSQRLTNWRIKGGHGALCG